MINNEKRRTVSYIKHIQDSIRLYVRQKIVFYKSRIQGERNKMINYGYLLSCKEKDNPSPFCRASYLMSNVGDLIKCYGRALRFPADKKLYMAEAMLAIGDILMQCRLIEHDYNLRQSEIEEDEYHEVDDYKIPPLLVQDTATILCQLTKDVEEDCLDDMYLGENIDTMIWCCMELCWQNNWNIEDVEHLGFLHVMERFEEFERRGWE